MSDNGSGSRRAEHGFEYQGRFYRLHVSDMGKDLMLIDRFTGMPMPEFFELVDDEVGLERGPVMLALVATSIRHGNPGWTVERIVRTVMDMSLADLTWVGVDEEEPDVEAMLPPSPEPTTESRGAAPSPSPVDDSSSSSTPPASSDSETSYATPA